jgi:hypothetical protein
MKIHTAMIVDEPENAPVLLLAKTEEELLAKVKKEMSGWFDGVQEATSLDELSDLYDEYSQERGEVYAGMFHSVEEL